MPDEQKAVMMQGADIGKLTDAAKKAITDNSYVKSK